MLLLQGKECTRKLVFLLKMESLWVLLYEDTSKDGRGVWHVVSCFLCFCGLARMLVAASEGEMEANL